MTGQRERERDAGGVDRRFPLFDSLRAIAALSVLAGHVAIYEPMPNNLRLRFLALTGGIAVFFVISGFLLYRPFVRARFERAEHPRTAAYAVRRALRIGPAYWLALPIVVLLVGASGEAPNATPVFTGRGIPAYFGFLQVYDSRTLFGGISAAWTLCVEASFYALLPLWAFLMRRTPHISTRRFLTSELVPLAGLAAIALVWMSVWAHPPTSGAIDNATKIEPWLYLLPAYLDHFALGMALAVASVVLTHGPARPRTMRTIDRVARVSPFLAVAAFLLIGQTSQPKALSFETGFFVRHELQAIAAVSLLLPAVFGHPDRGFVRRLLANRVLLWLGLVSYGIYLWHSAIAVKLFSSLPSLGRAGFAGAVLGVTVVAAAISFYALERHAIRLGRHLSHRRRSQDADLRMRDLARHERPEPGVP